MLDLCLPFFHPPHRFFRPLQGLFPLVIVHGGGIPFFQGIATFLDLFQAFHSTQKQKFVSVFVKSLFPA